MTRRLTTREELAQLAARQANLSEFIGRALAEWLDLAARADVLLDVLNEAAAAERPGRMV